MLVLSRKKDGRIDLLIETCGGLTPLGTVVVTKIEGGTVRLGFELRKDVRILRREINPDEKAVKA